MQNLTNENYPIIAGVEITTDSEGSFNLNALHKTSGEGEHKAPNQWLRTKQAKELILELEANLLKNNQTANMQPAHKVVNAVNGGSSPGTFAHELLAIEYAGWIAPKFRLMVNQTFLDYKTGRLAPVIPTTDWLDNPAQLQKMLISYTEQIEKMLGVQQMSTTFPMI